MPDPAPELHNLAADVRRVASAGSEVALHIVFAREWPALGIAAGLGDGHAARLWAGIRPCYSRYLAGLAFCGSCESRLRSSFTTAVAIDREGRAVTSFPLCPSCSRHPDLARQNAADVLRKAAGAPRGDGGGGRVERVATRFVFRLPGACVAGHAGRVEPYALDGATRAAVTDAVLQLWERLRAEVRRPFIEQVVELPPLARPPPREPRHEEFERWA